MEERKTGREEDRKGGRLEDRKTGREQQQQSSTSLIFELKPSSNLRHRHFVSFITNTPSTQPDRHEATNDIINAEKVPPSPSSALLCAPSPSPLQKRERGGGEEGGKERRERGGAREKMRERERETERDRERQRETERDRQTNRQTNRERERERAGC